MRLLNERMNERIKINFEAFNCTALSVENNKQKSPSGGPDKSRLYSLLFVRCLFLCNEDEEKVQAVQTLLFDVFRTKKLKNKFADRADFFFQAANPGDLFPQD